MTGGSSQSALEQLSHALDAARAAAAAIAHVGDPQTFQKGAAGPATVADLASQVAAAIVLHKHCGAGIRIVAEESWSEVERHGGADVVQPVCAAVRAAGLECTPDTCKAMLCAGEDGGGSGSFWAIDPLDGTKGYLRGGQFAVAIALINHGHASVGVLAAPRLGPRDASAGPGVAFAAVRGCGAWQTAMAERAPVSIRCAPWTPGAPVRVAASVEAAHTAADAVTQALGSIGPVQLIQMDSQAKYGMVARGSADAYVRQSTRRDYVESIWDHAAGALIAEEAGCVVTDLLGVPLDFSQGRGLKSNVGVVCAAPQLHSRVIQAFQGAVA